MNPDDERNGMTPQLLHLILVLVALLCATLVVLLVLQIGALQLVTAAMR